MALCALLGVTGCSRRNDVLTGEDDFSPTVDAGGVQTTIRPPASKSPPPLPDELEASENRDFPILLDPPDISELEEQFHASEDFLERSELVFRMADESSPKALETLRRLYFSEDALEMKVRILDSVDLVTSGNLEPVIPILEDAIRPGQDRDLRDSAIHTLMGLPPANVRKIWQGLLADPDFEYREMAEKVLEFDEILAGSDPAENEEPPEVPSTGVRLKPRRD